MNGSTASQSKTLYPEEEVLKAARDTRENIFNERMWARLKKIGEEITQKDIDDAVSWARYQKRKM